MRTIRLIKRLITELPQPARRYNALMWLVVLATFALAAATASKWILLAGIGVSGVFAFLFGHCIYHDRNGAATFWSDAYKESRGIQRDQFTFFDVPTAKWMGFSYMLLGLFWSGGSLVVMIQNAMGVAA